MICHYDIHGQLAQASCEVEGYGEAHITTSARMWFLGVKSGSKTRLVDKCKYVICDGILRHI